MVETFDPNLIEVTITEKAAKHFKRFIENNQGATAIQITVKKTGCSGLAYVVNPISEKPENHRETQQHGIVLYVDQTASMLHGLEIDYQTQEMGLSQLVYHNPNEKARCGCGESFTI